jgi:hypothetical protein
MINVQIIYSKNIKEKKKKVKKENKNNQQTRGKRTMV